MNDHLISLYIDDELDLQEKVEFVENVRDDNVFAQETIDMLDQEKLLMSYPQTSQEMKESGKIPGFSALLFHLWRPAIAGTFAAAVLVALVLLSTFNHDRIATDPPQLEAHRFILYSPENTQLNIVGTFTEWQPVPMKKVGSSGYWSLTLKIPRGEHKYSFIAGNGEMTADPTIQTRESDDFGGENSIIVIGNNNEPVS
jgi:hypothetical protein